MPFLQPRLTRVGSGTTNGVVGTNLYIPDNNPDPSGNIIYGDLKVTGNTLIEGSCSFADLSGNLNMSGSINCGGVIDCSGTLVAYAGISQPNASLYRLTYPGTTPATTWTSTATPNQAFTAVDIGGIPGANGVNVDQGSTYRISICGALNPTVGATGQMFFSMNYINGLTGAPYDNQGNYLFDCPADAGVRYFSVSQDFTVPSNLYAVMKLGFFVGGQNNTLGNQVTATLYNVEITLTNLD